MRERLQKVLAAAGVASRRRAEELIAGGAVTVNGRLAEVGQSVERDVDVIEVDGTPVRFAPSHSYLALNKPPGFVTSLRSTHGERTVVDLLGTHRRVFPVGRLDKDTMGLLLLTDDGDWANLVTHPRYGVEKEYVATVRGRPSPQALDRMRTGVPLPDGTVTSRADVRDLGAAGGNRRLSVTVVEGKKRQIRLMAEAVGHRVIKLQRVRIDSIPLGDLAEGAWRLLTPREVEGIRAYGHRATAPAGARPRAPDRD